MITGSSNELVIVHYTIETEKLNNQIRLALITDLHSCKYGEDQSELIGAINKQNPDVVLLGGDIFDDVLPDDNALIFLKAIAQEYPCYYISGNHEYWSGKMNVIKELVRTAGIIVLEGNCEQLQIGNELVNICGVDDPAYIGNNETELQTAEAFALSDTTKYNILLSHRPELTDIYKKYNYDLILSGHAHGGQWRIPGVLNGLYAPNQGFFPKYAGGEYSLDGTTMIVSRGLAKENKKIPRFFNPPELVIIDLL